MTAGYPTVRADAAPTPAAWAALLAARDGARALVGGPWDGLFGPVAAPPGGRVVVAQLGQSLDGRIATPSGHSHYVNGREAIVHLHRLRALVDAVVVGIGTVVADAPALTVRHVEGPSPARVVIDPGGRLPPDAKVLADDGRRRVVVRREDVRAALPAGVETLRLPAAADGRISPGRIVEALAAIGLRRVLVEGGAMTVSAFVAAGCVDRLHLAVAPLIIGSGPTGLSLPPIDRLDDALRPPVMIHRLGDDLLWDVDLAASRRARDGRIGERNADRGGRPA